MKRCSFEVAKAIKEAGYPQECGWWYNQKGVEFSYTEDYSNCYARPTYIDVWLWLWREKKFSIDIDCYNGSKWTTDINSIEFNDPEEAIIAAIDYLVDNNLIK